MLDNISSWTTNELARFIQKIIDTATSKAFNLVEAEEIIVSSKLTLKDRIVFSGLGDRLVGGTGQPVFAGTWASSANKVRFYKDPFQVVHLEGAAVGGVAGTAIFTLPPGYRPNYQGLYAVRVNGPAVGTIIVNTDGTVVHESGAVGLVALDGILFKIKTT